MSDDTKSSGPDSEDTSRTEGTGAAKTVEELRAQYEAALSKDAQGSKGTDPTVAALQAEVEKLRGAEADRTYRKEMDSFVIPAVSGELKVDPSLVEMWVNKQAGENPELMDLWNERSGKRKEFKAAIEALQPDFAKYVETLGLSPKRGKSEDTGKLASAVRSARSTPASQPRDLGSLDWGSMSDNEFAMKSQEVFRLAKAGQLQ